MGASQQFNKPDFSNAMDADIDAIRDNYHFLMCVAATGSIVLPGWQTTVTATDYSEPDTITLTRGTKKIIINYTWNADSSVDTIQVCYDDGVSSPGLTCFTAININYDDEGNVTGGSEQITDPTEISGCILWLDASDSGVTSNQWDDKSGEDNHAVADGAPQYPTFAGGVATFDGTANHLDITTISGLTASEFFFVQKHDGGAKTGWMRIGSSVNADWFTPSLWYSSVGSVPRHSAFPTLSTDVTDYHVCNVVSTSSEWRMVLDGSEEYSATSGTSVGHAATWEIGKSFGASYFGGSIKMILVYNRELSTEERARVMAYLGNI